MSTSRTIAVATTALTLGWAMHAHAADPTWGWQAQGLANGDVTEWDPTFNTTAESIDWSGTGSKLSGATNFVTLNEWVNSPSYILDDNASADDSWNNILGDATTDSDASWELVFRPGDYVGKHTLFNTGGNGDGLAFVLDGSTLEFRFQDTPSPDQQAFATFDLSTLDLEGDEFFHVVGIADLDNPGNEGTASLWVNGQLRNTASSDNSGTGGIDDWDGGDDAELGKGNNIPGGNPFNPDIFTGDIAVFNFYGNTILTDQEIEDSYDAITGANLSVVQTTGWTDVEPAGASTGDYFGTLVTVGTGESGTNASGAFSGEGQHTNADGDDSIGWAVGDYVFEGNFSSVTEPDSGDVLAVMDLFIPAGATDIDLTLLFNQDMEGTLEPDDALRFEIYDVIGDTVLASLTLADDDGLGSSFTIGDSPEILASLDNAGLTHVQARIIYLTGAAGWTDGDQEEIQIGNSIFKATYVPEPSSLALLGLGGLLLARRRR